MVKAYRDEMDAGRNPNKTIVYGYKSPDAVDWTPFLKNAQWDVKLQTGLPLTELKQLGRAADGYPVQIQAASARGKDHRRPPSDGRGKAAARLGHGGKSRLCGAAEGWVSLCASRARTRGGEPSFTATLCCTTRTANGGTKAHIYPAAPYCAGPARFRRSSTRCCPKKRCSVSNTVMQPPSRMNSSSGRRSSAISPMARRW